MVVVDPNVSTDSSFLTSTFFLAIRFDVRVKATVTVASKPSGTFATIIPMQKTMFSIQSVPLIALMMKNKTPRKMAKAEMMSTKWWISICIVVCSVFELAARPAILPNNVRSPVFTTMPVAVPSTALVPKNAIFLVSNGFSSVHSVDLANGSDSPVKEELSTFNLLLTVIRMSAGILSPSFTSITSPTTRSAASQAKIFPSLCTTVCGGRKFLNFSMVFSDLNSCKKENTAVMMTTVYNTIPSTKFSVSFGLRP
mmetsp:Transcript_1462/g.4738  ORF Transcript_1462/g.4738 Transcript_1462/m.4738 type:complete len:254 (-) Transcript_1462:540-1301(-)